MGQQAPCCAAPDQEATGEALEETEKFPTSSSPARGGGGGGDSQEECLNDEENQRRMDAMKGRSRRAGVAAEGLSATQVKDYVKPVYPKDEATQQRIQAVIKGSDKMQVLFGHLDASSMVDIVNAFQEVTRKKDEDVIRQGDEGDCLYIISEGAVDVFVARPGAAAAEEGSARGAKVVSLGPGALFGELALMYSAPRAATVTITSEECRLWQLDREPFKMLLAKNGQKQYETYEGWLSEVEILKSLNKYELSRLSELLESTPYDAGEEIIVQGEPGDKFYMLEDGACAAFITGEEGERKVKEYRRRGDYFGEIALLRDEPRKATVRATDEGALVLWVSPEDFASVLGPIQDILKKDLDKYPQYADFLKES
mmetsp:Transcript_33967/g.89518  ORF Transcript_33967/g.89518 Transcript_33967/m.89518 type:complete len:370 (-) Transcript_33967:14-1123(-)